MATLVVVAMVFGSALFAARPAIALNSAESSFLSLTNGERSSRGVKKLALAGDLTSIARQHSARMAADGKIYHNSSLGSQVGGNWKMLGENVGKGPSVKSIHNAFMASTAHRVHILDPRFDQVGIGTVTKDDVIYVTEVFADRTASKPVVHKTVTHKPVVRRVVKVVRRAPPPPPAAPKPQIVSMLLLLAGLDADNVDPRTGTALRQPVAVTLRQTPH